MLHVTVHEEVCEVDLNGVLRGLLGDKLDQEAMSPESVACIRALQRDLKHRLEHESAVVCISLGNRKDDVGSGAKDTPVVPRGDSPPNWVAAHEAAVVRDLGGARQVERAAFRPLRGAFSQLMSSEEGSSSTFRGSGHGQELRRALEYLEKAADGKTPRLGELGKESLRIASSWREVRAQTKRLRKPSSGGLDTLRAMGLVKRGGGFSKLRSVFHRRGEDDGSDLSDDENEGMVGEVGLAAAAVWSGTAVAEKGAGRWGVGSGWLSLNRGIRWAARGALGRGWFKERSEKGGIMGGIGILREASKRKVTGLGIGGGGGGGSGEMTEEEEVVVVVRERATKVVDGKISLWSLSRLAHPQATRDLTLNISVFLLPPSRSAGAAAETDPIQAALLAQSSSSHSPEQVAECAAKMAKMTHGAAFASADAARLVESAAAVSSGAAASSVASPTPKSPPSSRSPRTPSFARRTPSLTAPSTLTIDLVLAASAAALHRARPTLVAHTSLHLGNAIWGRRRVTTAPSLRFSTPDAIPRAMPRPLPHFPVRVVVGLPTLRVGKESKADDDADLESRPPTIVMAKSTKIPPRNDPVLSYGSWVALCSGRLEKPNHVHLERGASEIDNLWIARARPLPSLDTGTSSSTSTSSTSTPSSSSTAPPMSSHSPHPPTTSSPWIASVGETPLVGPMALTPWVGPSTAACRISARQEAARLARLLSDDEELGASMEESGSGFVDVDTGMVRVGKYLEQFMTDAIALPSPLFPVHMRADASGAVFGRYPAGSGDARAVPSGTSSSNASPPPLARCFANTTHHSLTAALLASPPTSGFDASDVPSSETVLDEAAASIGASLSSSRWAAEVAAEQGGLCAGSFHARVLTPPPQRWKDTKRLFLATKRSHISYLLSRTTTTTPAPQYPPAISGSPPPPPPSPPEAISEVIGVAPEPTSSSPSSSTIPQPRVVAGAGVAEVVATMAPGPGFYACLSWLKVEDEGGSGDGEVDEEDVRRRKDDVLVSHCGTVGVLLRCDVEKFPAAAMGAAALFAVGVRKSHLLSVLPRAALESLCAALRRNPRAAVAQHLAPLEPLFEFLTRPADVRTALSPVRPGALVVTMSAAADASEGIARKALTHLSSTPSRTMSKRAASRAKERDEKKSEGEVEDLVRAQQGWATEFDDEVNGFRERVSHDRAWLGEDPLEAELNLVPIQPTGSRPDAPTTPQLRPSSSVSVRSRRGILSASTRSLAGSRRSTKSPALSTFATFPGSAVALAGWEKARESSVLSAAIAPEVSLLLRKPPGGLSEGPLLDYSLH